jgi:riboflavin kinase / FMN adenylyltransferase
MKAFQYHSDFKKWCKKKVVCTIGNFDGVHLAHQKILGKIKTISKRHNAYSLVITFKNHPLQVGQKKQKPIVTSLPHKLILLDRYGVDACFVFNFSKRFKELRPEEFLKQALFKHFDIQYILVGFNFFFGKNKQGTVEDIKRFAQKRHVLCDIASPIKVAGQAISSSRVREAVASGDLDMANRLLGRNYSVLATVVQGAGRGTGLGFPTANLDVHSEVLPPRGVYIVRVESCHNTLVSFKKIKDITADCCFTPYIGVLNLGTTPTFGQNIPFHAEVHIPNINCDFREKLLEVTFLERLRAEKKFDSEEDLCRQISLDIKKAQTYKR